IGTPTSVNTSITLDGTGKSQIAYYNATTGDLKFANFNGTSWSTSTVDSLGDVGTNPSSSLDVSGDVHIAYIDSTNGQIKAADWVGAGLPAPMGGNAYGKVQAPTLFKANNVYSSSVT